MASGQKTLEIRSWRTRYRGALLICATRKPPCAGVPAGCALCTVELVDCRPMTPQDQDRAGCTYHPGLFAWVLAHVKPLSRPLPVRGRQRMFEVDLAALTRSVQSRSLHLFEGGR